MDKKLQKIIDLSDHLMILNPTYDQEKNIHINIDEKKNRIGYANSSTDECWVLGGSTVWGDRLEGTQTITSWMNKYQSDLNFLNYGIPGNNSNSQLRFMIYLLKSRNIIPKCVIWLDGLNDGAFIFLRPIVPAYDRSSYGDRDQLISITGHRDKSGEQRPIKTVTTPKQFSPIKVINRDSETAIALENIQKFDLNTYRKINNDVATFILDSDYVFNGNEKVINEAITNHIQNVKIAKSILLGLSNEKSNFYWFIQPNGELNKSNPFITPSHFSSNRYLISKFYQKELLSKSKELSIDLTSLDKNCSICYVDESHYSPNFSSKIAKEIINKIH